MKEAHPDVPIVTAALDERAEREGVYRARSRGCGRQDVRDEVGRCRELPAHPLQGHPIPIRQEFPGRVRGHGVCLDQGQRRLARDVEGVGIGRQGHAGPGETRGEGGLAPRVPAAWSGRLPHRRRALRAAGRRSWRGGLWPGGPHGREAAEAGPLPLTVRFRREGIRQRPLRFRDLPPTVRFRRTSPPGR